MVSLANIKEETLKKQIENGVHIVYFYANWCGPCLVLDNILKEVQKESVDVKILKIDVENNEELVKKMDVDTVPTIMTYKEGKLKAKKIGYISKENLINLIKK